MGVLKLKWIISLLLLANVSAEPFHYPYRDIEKPIFQMGDHIKILQCSPLRTGSTFIYNILQFLFEDTLLDAMDLSKKVVKSHNFDHYDTFIAENFDVYLVTTIRHPLEAFASLLVAHQNIDSDGICSIEKKRLDRMLSRFVIRNKRLIEMIDKNLEERVLVLRFEKFNNDQFTYVFDELEDFFSITIEDAVREDIVAYFCMDSMRQLADKYMEFKNTEPVTGIHGNHINQVKWREVIPEEYHEEFLKKVDFILDYWGYPKD